MSQTPPHNDDPTRPVNRPATPPGFPPAGRSQTDALFGAQAGDPNADPSADPSETLLPRGRAPKDPGSSSAAGLAWTALLVLLATVFGLQQLSASAATAADPLDPASASQELTSRVLIKIAYSMGEVPPRLDQQIAPEATEDALTSPHDLIQLAATRLAMGNVEGARNSLNNAEVRLATLQAGEELTPAAEDITGRIETFRAFLDSETGTLDLGYEGWFDTLDGYLTPTGLPAPSAPNYDAMLDDLASNGTALVALLLGVGGVLLLGLLAGIGALIYVSVQISSGRIRKRFTPPVPGGSVYLETAAVFTGAFLLVQIVSSIIAQASSPAAASQIGMVLQWSLLAVPLYPLLRGVTFAQLRHDLGLRAGGVAGVIREAGCGIIGYLVTIPIYLVAVVFTALLLALWTFVLDQFGVESGPPSNPIIDAVQSSSPAELFLLLTLAVIWAPLVEELVFRGAMFRHLRSRFGPFVAGLGSSAVFAMMHGYSLPLLVPVFTLGVMFSLIREYRGSLVAPITAHFIHNAALLGTMIVALQLIMS